jgi:hypothetical protein
MLAVPTISSAIAGTSAVVSVGSTRIPVTELVAGENSRRTEGMGQDPHVSKRVHACGVKCQGISIAFGVMIGNEGVGRTAVAGRISSGPWATKGSDTTVLEGALEVESVLEGLDLADLRVFGGSNSGSATVINLWCTSVGQRAMIPEGARTSWVT